MKAVLEFLKTHAISLVCGVIALIAIVGAVLGISGQSSVTKKMNDELARAGAASISSLKGSAKNLEVIEQEKKRGQAFEADYKKTVEEAKRINRREPLMAGIFPKVEQSSAAFAFKTAYQKEVERLQGTLNAGTLPTEDELAEAKRDVEELREQEKDIQTETATDRGLANTASTAPPTVIDESGGGRFARGAMIEDMGGGGRFGSARGGASMSADMGPNTEPKYNYVLRARVAKARNFRCYMDRNTFQIHPLVAMTGQPKPEEMWLAQVSLWIQRDIVEAIANLNREAAKSVQDGETNVEHSPVKRLNSVRVRGYVADKMIPFPSANDAGTGESTMTASFTDKKSNEQFDVIRFDVVAVVDQRESLRVIDAITKANFNKLLAVEYNAVDRRIDQDQLGYFYGTAPVIQMRMEFETYMARDVFDEMKPKEFATLLGGAPPAP